MPAGSFQYCCSGSPLPAVCSAVAIWQGGRPRGGGVIKKWTIENFKSFKGETSLDFEPLTLICGANSSGKSSVIQSILLIKQTVQHAQPSRPIALNGPLVRLGAFSDILNCHCRSTDEYRHIGLGWEVGRRAVASPESYYVGRAPTAAVNSVAIKFAVDTRGPSEQGETLDIQPSLLRTSIKASVLDYEDVEHIVDASVHRSSKRGRRPRYDSLSLDEASKPFEFIVDSIDEETKLRNTEGRADGKVLGCVTRHFFLEKFVVRHDKNRELARIASGRFTQNRYTLRRKSISNVQIPISILRKMRAAVDDGSSGFRQDELENLFGGASDAISLGAFIEKAASASLPLRRAVAQWSANHQKEVEDEIYDFLERDLTISALRDDVLSEAISSNHDFFRFFVNYLGPLRDEPKPLYPLQALSGPTDVGIKGELTAAVLHLHQNKIISYVAASCFSDDGCAGALTNATLKDAVEDWLRYLGVATEVETTEKGKFGHELRIKINKSTGFQDLTNVGVGVSQVLPIIVMCLLADRGSTVILEQPELHLHPAVQARLADFFISMALSNKQCVLETHGEYLVERIRYRVVGDLSNVILGKTAIYFFEQRDGETSCKRVPLNRYGAVEDWPDDFFDQSQKESERIVLKAMQRRRAESRRTEA